MVTLGLMLQAVLLAVVILGIFTLIGYGIVAVFAPNLEGGELLLAPSVGFAFAVVSCTWFSPFLIAPHVVTLLILSFGIWSVFLARRNRMQLRCTLSNMRGTLLWGILGAISIYISLLAFVFAAQRFSYDGNGIDAIVLYAPAIEYLKIHPHSLFTAASVVPEDMPDYALQAMRIWGQNAFPALGRVDAALSALLGWPGYQLIEPLDAWFIAFSLFPLYALFRYGFASSRRVAIIATVLSLISQLNIWIFGMGFSSHARAMLLFPACLLLTMCAFRMGQHRVSILAGITNAALIGIYFPITVLLIIAAVGYGVAILVQRRDSHFVANHLKASVLVLVSSGILAMPSLFTFFGVQGFHEWLSLLQVRFPGAGIKTFFPLGSMLGIVPLTDVMQGQIFIGLGPTSFWHRPEWELLGSAMAVVVVFLAMFGFAALLWNRKFPEATMFFTVIAYVLYIRFIARYPYGFMRMMCYILPFSSLLIALGAIEFPQMLGRSLSHSIPVKLVNSPSTLQGEAPPPLMNSSLVRAIYPAWKEPATCALRACGFIALAAVLSAQLFASVTMERYIANMHTPEFPPGASNLVALQDLVPLGSHVYMYNDVYGPANAHYLLVAASFLSGRAVTVQHGFNDADPAKDKIIRASGFNGYDYILLSSVAALRLVGSVERVWQDSHVGLQLYRRTGKNIAFLSEEAIMPLVVDVVVRLLDARGVKIDGEGDREALTALMRVYMERPELQTYGSPDALNISAYLASAVTRASTNPRLASHVDRYAAWAHQAAVDPVIRVGFVPLSDTPPQQVNPRYQDAPWCVDESMPGMSAGSNYGANEYPLGSTITLSGFAMDPTTNRPASGVTIFIDGTHDVIAEAGLARPDIASAFNSPTYQNSGFRVTIPAELLPAGDHLLTAKIGSADGTSYFVPSWSRTVLIK